MIYWTVLGSVGGGESCGRASVVKGLGLVRRGKDNTSPDAQHALGRLGGVGCPTPDSADTTWRRNLVFVRF